MIDDITYLLTPATLMAGALLGLAFGAFASRFDVVPEGSTGALLFLVGTFGVVGILGLAGMRTLDPTYPGEHPMRTVSTLVYLLVMTAGAYAGDRVVRWWERRIDVGHGDR